MWTLCWVFVVSSELHGWCGGVLCEYDRADQTHSHTAPITGESFRASYVNASAWVIVLLVLGSCSYAALLFCVRVQCSWKTSAVLEAGPSSSEHKDHNDSERRSSLLKNMLVHTDTLLLYSPDSPAQENRCQYDCIYRRLRADHRRCREMRRNNNSTHIYECGIVN